MTRVGARRNLIGSVISNRMDKTALVLVERITKHKTYGKYLRKRSKYLAHDPKNMCQIGDKVRIVEARPLSKRKRWQVVDLIKKADNIV
jgi:small subunit ribosomal protein S17